MILRHGSNHRRARFSELCVTTLASADLPAPFGRIRHEDLDARSPRFGPRLHADWGTDLQGAAGRLRWARGTAP